MKVIAIIMLVAGILLFSLARQIANGRTDLIMEYHQSNIPTDLKYKYGIEFSKALYLMSAVTFQAGFGINSGSVFSIVILVVGYVFGILKIVSVQKKYNKGIF